MRAGEVSAREASRSAAARLKRAGVPEPIASAEVLLSELLGIGRAELAASARPLTAEQTSLYEAWISRREKREPVQRILGYAYFRNLVLDLNKETLIALHDKQLRAAYGGDAAASSGGSTTSTECLSLTTCPECLSSDGLEGTEGAGVAASCCRKSCNR